MKKLLLLLVIFISSTLFAQEQELSNDAKVLYNSSITSFKANKPDSALIYVDKALELQKHSMLFELKGKILLQQKKFNDAIAAFDEALKLNPTDKELANLKQSVEIDIVIQAGDNFLKEKKYTEAIEKYKQAQSMNPADLKQEQIKNRLVVCYQNQAVEKAQTGDYIGAIAVLDGAKNVLDDETIKNEKLKIYKNAAAKAYSAGDNAAALNFYEKALEINKDDAELKRQVAIFYNNLAAKEAKDKKYDKSIEYYKKSLSYFENDGTYINILNSMLAAKKYNDLITYSNELIAAKKTKAAAHYFKAVALNSTAKYQDAVEACKAGETITEDANFSQRCAKLRSDIENYLKKAASQKK